MRASLKEYQAVEAAALKRLNGVAEGDSAIVSFRYTLPLALHFHQQQDIGKVDTATPSLFQYADNSQSLLHVKDIHAGLELQYISVP